MDRLLAITGSARGDGNTALTVAHLRRALALADDHIIDLGAHRLEPFRYEPPPPVDDFLMIVDRILAHQHIVFATPVYWYAMSGLMKVFFDRLTDLLLTADGRRTGRALAGRDVWLIATGTDEELPDGFDVPFVRTAEYFDMRWRQAFYVCVPKETLPAGHEFPAVENLAGAIRAAE